MPGMFEFEELLLIAYKKERATSRRLSKLTSLSAHAALTQTLEKSAGTRTLAELVSARHRERVAAEQARHHREQERAAARAARKVRPVVRDAAAWHAWFDGSAYPNPGKIGIGGMLESPDGEVVKISARAGHGDSCEAEYLALIAVLEAAVARKPAPAKLVIHGDSQVVIEDVLRDEASSAPALSTYAAQARALIAQLADVRLQWIPRARNAAADALSQHAVRHDPHALDADIHERSRTSTAGVSPNVSLNA
ncbi:ribonuclease HI family protein [Caballeronia sp. 15715]|uniref:ribonuclease HI family protein n=1 Tax=unclassified Caballeronia TaxID=2646786 RepID=UPI0039E3AF2B